MEILEFPNPALKERAREVEPGDRDVKRLVKRMIKLMREAPGVGLAATQLGVQKRVIVLQPAEDEPAYALVNPRVVSTSDDSCTEEEGCLSLPGIVVPIERPASIVCQAQEIDGTPIDIEADDLLARILQHEIDHLDGILIIDRASPEERREALRRYRELHS